MAKFNNFFAQSKFLLLQGIFLGCRECFKRSSKGYITYQRSMLNAACSIFFNAETIFFLSFVLGQISGEELRLKVQSNCQVVT